MRSKEVTKEKTSVIRKWNKGLKYRFQNPKSSKKKKKKGNKWNPQNTGSKKHQSKHVYTANN